MNRLKKGFTIVELLVVVAIIALLIAILLPAIGKARDAALVTQSLGNLRNLAAANASYGADWNDRQFTACPDDAGLFQGNCATYIAQVCPPQQLLGWDQNGGLWGYWLGGGACPGNYPGNCGNWICYKPIDYTAGDKFGSFRMCNVKSFNDYVNGRYYDNLFWAPKDKITLEKIQKYFQQPGEFYYDGSTIEYPTYCWSPAAMWSPDVLSHRQGTGNSGGYTNPNTLPGAYKSPAVGQATYPDLKTRMLEHQWLQNREGGDVNPAFSGQTPWYFNHGYNSAPATMFFDGHIQLLGVTDAQEADSRVLKQNANMQGFSEKGLWSRGTGGYYNTAGYDMLVNTAFHICTTDGILGRDVVGQK
ncbi:MAG: prepilin-type N-terminal cleavage/methylation domain-containing protein [Phycisphaerales bacterium]